MPPKSAVRCLQRHYDQRRHCRCAPRRERGSHSLLPLKSHALSPASRFSPLQPTVYCVNQCGVVYETLSRERNQDEWSKTLRRLNAHESKRCPNRNEDLTNEWANVGVELVPLDDEVDTVEVKPAALASIVGVTEEDTTKLANKVFPGRAHMRRPRADSYPPRKFLQPSQAFVATKTIRNFVFSGARAGMRPYKPPESLNPLRRDAATAEADAAAAPKEHSKR